MDVRDAPPERARPMSCSLSDIREMLPDEGIVSSYGDKLKLQAASDPEVLRALASALSAGNGEAKEAANIVCSIAISPAAATNMCTLGVVSALCKSLAKRRGFSSTCWRLAALACLSQHDEIHGELFKANAVEMLAPYTLRVNGNHPDSDVQHHVLAAISLAFLCRSGGSNVAARVPLRTVHDMVNLLHRRLLTADSASVVTSSLFCGLPVTYQPCFVTKALAALLEVSSSHAATAWHTLLPELLVGIFEGDFPNDEKTDLPLNSPDSLETAGRCRAALLSQMGSTFVEGNRGAELRAVRVSPGGAQEIHQSRL